MATPKNQNANEGGAVARDESKVIKLMSINGIRRAGIRFPAREPVEVDLSELTKDQMKALENEPDLRPVR